MPYGTVNADSITDSNGSVFSPSSSLFKNRIINGDMRIDQRNAGASVTPTTNPTYTLDRWNSYLSQASKFSVQQNAASVTPPVGFTNYLGVTSLSAYTVGSSETFGIAQRIEGLNAADLAWGTANAATVTLSFWVRSSLTGTFGGAIKNSAENRVYPFTYTVTAANTWEKETITITGDTSGTWLTTNGVGITVVFSLGTGATVSGTAGAWGAGNLFSATGATSVVGTNGATFYITGVQLEKGTTATSFDYRPYGTELALCQRYYYRVGPSLGNEANVSLNGFAATTTVGILTVPFPVTMRIAPTALEQSGTAANYAIRYAGSSAANCSSVPLFTSGQTFAGQVALTVASGLTAGGTISGRTGSASGDSAYFGWSVEL
jgi:hypothetical protein